MATINLIKGTIKGKVGVLVGSSWKGQPYIKTYTPPSNPKTPDQVAVRTVFKQILHIARKIYYDILKPYTPPYKRLTPLNQMIRINRQLLTNKVFDYSKLKIFEGPLSNDGFSPEYTGIMTPVEPDVPVFTVNVQWAKLSGQASDIAIPILYDESSDSCFFTQSTRENRSVTLTVIQPLPLDFSKLHLYLVFVRPPAEGTNEHSIVSNTAYMAISELRAIASQDTPPPQDTDQNPAENNA